ncbi:hypothetical protein M8C21_028298 [Ambrosia artemisiifolia]|uniref:Protein SCAR n=1 Tax=Ambrosia artemisiifolia TaxID=4212 RepID=A0AAD5BQV1_AMBAR|nr:hypothetical protein M8C21_028298 [Ambrosia artemisiifolia]
MPFSRYQIRNEFSLADPELYKAADKDDPEALLEGVAMAGLVGVLRQLGDLAEFAAEIFHGLHEEVMATAARGHGLLTRVQQVESDLPIIERAFLSQTGHSAFFSSPGISWHPNLQTEQNLITKGDLPRFVMDSYEESRGPPRLFLLDKFDVAGAGACLKRYTDPSFYKVEVPSYGMMNAEAQRDKKIRKTKKKGSRWKNGDTPDVFQASHVKLHQLLLEERVQNGASEPARRVKIKKREIKFPFDTETGKGYMEKFLSSPPEDKLVHEVKMVTSPLHLRTRSSEEAELETLEDKMINSPLDDIEEKHISVVEENKGDGIEDVYQSDDVASETDNYMDALATMESEVETDVEFRAANSDPIIKQETFSDSNLEKLQKEQVSDSQSASDDVSSPMKSKVTTLSDSNSDSTMTSPNNMSPRVNSPHAYASTEIPFRPRALSTQVSDNCIEASDNADLLVDQDTLKESNSKESDLSEMSSSNYVDVNIPTKDGEIEIDPENTIASIDICEDDVLESKSDPAEATVSYSNEDETGDKETSSVDSENENANVSVCDPDDGKNGDNHVIPEGEKELDERKTELVISETKDSSPVSVPDEYESNEIKDLSATEEPGQNILVVDGLGNVHNSDESVEKESVISPELDSIPSAYYDHNNGSENDIDESSTNLIESDEKKETVISPELNSTPSASNDQSSNQISDNICDGHGNEVDNMERESLESFISLEPDSAYNDHPIIQSLHSVHKNGDENDADNPEKESVKKKELSEESVMSTGSDSIPSAYDDHANNGNETDGDNLETESIESGEKKELSEEPEPIISPESDSVPSAYHDHPNIQLLDSIYNNGNENDNDNDNDNPSTGSNESGEKKESSEESVIVPELDSIPSGIDHSNIQVVSPDADIQSNTDFLDHGPDLAESAEAQESKSLSVDQDRQTNAVSIEDNTDQLETLESRNHANPDPVEPPVVDLLLPTLAPINMEEPPPLPPLPPMHWMMGRSQNPSFMSIPGGGQADISHFPPVFPQIETHPTLNQNEISRNEISEHDHDHEVNKAKSVEEIVAQPPVDREESQNNQSFNLKPAVPTRPIIQGPTTNLRVAAILEKANAIRQAFAGSDDDEDDDSWSDS